MNPTEQPDTATIRACVDEYGPHAAEVIRGLCDALDAARADRNDLSGAWLEMQAQRDSARENLAFAQQRAADNALRAQIGEEKIVGLVAEIYALRAQLRGCPNES